jgi:putative endopeptidase
MNRSLIALATLALAGCATPKPAPAPHAAVGSWGVDYAAMDKSVAPGDDFFGYANGTWLKTSVIPPDRSYSGVNLEIDQKNEARLKAILVGLTTEPDGQLSPEQRKLRDLYAAFMDTAHVEQQGLGPAKPELAAIAAIKTLDDVAMAMGTPGLGLDGPVSRWIDIDDKKPGSYAVWLSQSGLGMPDRDYYLRNDKAFRDTRAAYKKYLAAMLSLAGMIDVNRRAAAIFDLETKMAKAEWPAADRRDALKVYNKMSFSALRKLAPQFPWRAFFAASGVPLTAPSGERSFIVMEKSAFPALARIFASTSVAVWRDYMTVRYLHSLAGELPQRIDDTDFGFYGTVLEGSPKQLDRAMRAVELVDDAMGEALGKLYVARYFPPEAKAKALALVANLLKAYDADMRSLDWMTPATKEKALAKLHNIVPKIGYPDKWRDYSALSISPDDLVGDVKSAAVFEWNRELKRIDEPVDRTEWGMSPQTNNDYYDDELVEIVFPAGSLQPPFFDPNADDAVNYGEIGATIGHEISHAFDDQGSKYDASGALDNWWTKTDRQTFDARTKTLVDQYDRYEPVAGMHVNGRLTLGENIADLAGLVIAHKAYHLSLGDKPAPIIDGYTGDQRFFLAYAQSWREKWRDALLRDMLVSDPHSPDKFRVNGVVRNIDAWYAAFGIKPGDALYLPPDKRVRLW